MRFAEAKIHMCLKCSIFALIFAIVQVQNLFVFFFFGGGVHIYIYIYGFCLVILRYTFLVVSKNTVRPTLLFQAKGENGQLDWPENNSTERFFCECR